MSFKTLPILQQEIIRQCLVAAAEGPFFPEWEFSTIFGIDRDELSNVIKAWPNIDDNEEIAFLAINNSMNNLLGYPHGEKDKAWHHYIHASPEELRQTYTLWTKSKKINGGIK